MKMTTAATLLAALTVSTVALAGERSVSLGKESKAPVVPPTPCFGDHEFQVDIFGQYSVGEGPDQAGIFRDHGWGGGVGLNYFFSRNVGLGIDAAWLDAKASPASGDVSSSGEGSHRRAVHNFSGSLIYRMPIDSACLAPYIYAGGGFAVDGEQWATAHAGAGLEYRIKPQSFGVFIDGRWTYLGDRFGHDDLNYFSSRVGFRFVF
jgi:hypothetical protein